ncbi:hypothetical protein [Bradyrhizobium sp. ISRA464]|uniref:hypothetical protein n=1 Tax=Bradyrhizobium sp. ISRA464 TaxID=2866200 RepID=UPI0024796B8F|nr:hypothetical protein [Bradyrhizobium sp. ISRA464]WGS26012.1 hypothetical protein MTX19_30275 [Bradyrhizobium sp. ISRA464]WGS26027.1 hypothetical protein MTX19_30410 [Bradyrhizobium sp. ISRA464]
MAIAKAISTNFFCLAQVLGARFLVRVQTNRLAEPPSSPSPTNAAHRVFAQVAAVPWSGRHRVATGGQDGETAFLQIKFASVKTLPPIGKQKRYALQTLIYIYVLDVDPPSNRDPIDWKLVTNLPVDDLAAAVEKLDWYALRWKVEMFHKIMNLVAVQRTRDCRPPSGW